MYRTLILFAAAAVVMLGTSPQAEANVLYGTDGNGGDLSTLYTVDPGTGVTSSIGPVGYVVNGLESYNGTLYATTSLNDPSFHGLLTVNPLTGAGTPVGTGWGGSITARSITEMAMDSAGNAYGWGEPNEDDLYSIDLGAGTASRVGESGLDTFQHGIAFDLADTLYLVNGADDTYTIATGTGASTFIGSIGTASGSGAHHGDVDPMTGLYTGLDDIAAIGSSPNSLVTVDLAGVATVGGLVLLDRPLHTLAYESVVPEPSSLALTALGFAALGALRRRKRA